MTIYEDNIVDFYVLENDIKTQYHFRISSFEVGDEDCSCSVLLSPLLKKEKRIFGVDEIQVRNLAIEFVSTMLSGKKIFNLQGDSVELKQLL